MVDVDPIRLHTARGQGVVVGGEILGVCRAAGIPDEHSGHRNTVPAGRSHRALLRAGVMGLSAVSSAGCSGIWVAPPHVPEEVPKRTGESCRRANYSTTMSLPDTDTVPRPRGQTFVSILNVVPSPGIFAKICWGPRTICPFSTS